MSKLNQEFKFIKRRNTIYKQLDNYLESFGYIKVEPDYFEDYQSFITSNERIKQEKMVKLLNPNGRVSILRPDITTNIMKQIVPYYTPNSEFRLFYNATIFRQSKKQLEQSRHFGLELLGKGNEMEVINIVLGLFKTFNLSFKLDIGNQSFVNELIKSLSLDKLSTVMLKEAIKSKNKKEIDDILEPIINSNEKSLIKDILLLNGTWSCVKKKVEKYNLSKEQLNQLHILNSLDNSDDIEIDLALMSQYDYYSGIVLQGYLENVSEPILFGGRYDKLTEQFGRKIEAVGVSFDLEAFLKEVQQ